MLKNFFLITWRGLIKNRVYSVINIAGLAIGMAVVLLIGLWVFDELNYNKGFAHYDRVQRVMITVTHGNTMTTNTSVPVPLSADLRTKYAGNFEAVSMTSWNADHIFAIGDKLLKLQGLYAQPDMMHILALRTLDGQKAVLDDPSSMLISRSTAIALYGSVDVVGKTVRFDNRKDFQITGVFEDMPYNSDFRETNYFVPWGDYEAANDWVKHSSTQWTNNAFQMFASLREKADLNSVRAKIAGVANGHGRKDKPVVVLHPMTNWHLYDDWVSGKNVGGAIQFVWMFGIIGGFVLLLACINFMNLSTARSEKRAKEVGIRKSVGSQRWQLVGQFLGESVFVALLAFVLSLLLVELALPWFNNVADKRMQLFWGSPVFWSVALGGTLLAGLIAGSYPAFYLSSFRPVRVLKGAFSAGRWSALPRRVLIVLQFTVSVSLIIGTIIVFQQIVYVKDRPVGYERNGLITMDILSDDMRKHYQAIREELLQSGAATHVAESNSPTTQVYSNQSSLEWEGKDPSFVPSFAVIFASHDYGQTVGLQFVQGRDFSLAYPSDSTAIVLNETSVKYMGLKSPIGATVKYGRNGSATLKDFHVIGVVKDMVMDNPFYPVKQSIWVIDDNDMANVLEVRLNPSMSVSKALPMIGAVMHKYDPATPFDYYFNVEAYAQKFQLQDRIGKLAGFFTVFAIFISCLGLFGLASFVAEQRMKEIGVRKVLGASVFRLWGLLSRDFLLLVGIAFALAVPLAWNVMQGWLRHYSYRVTISVWVFVLTMALAMVITLLTVSWQALRAAQANPVRALRSE